MKIKTQDLTGPALDWAVEVAEEMTVSQREFQPSTNWSQGGPIIERENIGLQRWNEEHEWRSDIGGDFDSYGPTPLIAAMRCFVASRLGDEVEIPEELL